MAHSTDQMFTIMVLKLDHYHECNTAVLKIYILLIWKSIWELKKKFFEIHKSALDSVPITACKIQNLIIYIKSWKARLNGIYR